MNIDDIRRKNWIEPKIEGYLGMDSNDPHSISVDGDDRCYRVRVFDNHKKEWIEMRPLRNGCPLIHNLKVWMGYDQMARLVIIKADF